MKGRLLHVGDSMIVTLKWWNEVHEPPHCCLASTKHETDMILGETDDKRNYPQLPIHPPVSFIVVCHIRLIVIHRLWNWRHC